MIICTTRHDTKHCLYLQIKSVHPLSSWSVSFSQKKKKKKKKTEKKENFFDPSTLEFVLEQSQ